MAKIKPLFVLPDLKGGGAERATLTLLRSLDRSRFAPQLFLLKRQGVYWNELPADVIPDAGLSGHTRLSVGFPKVLAALTKRARGADILVGALELDATYFSWFAGALTNRPVVGSVQVAIGPYLRRLARWHSPAVRWIYPRLDHLVAISSGVAQDLKAYIGLEADSVHTISDALDADRVRRASQAPIPSQLERVFERPTVVAAGRLSYQKGFDCLLRAYRMAVDRGINHNLVILGDGPDRDSLEELTRTLGLSGRVWFPGFVDNPYPVFKSASLFVLSSRFEGLAMVLLEAMALGTPVVSTDCPHGPREIIGDDSCGLLVPPNDPMKLAEAMLLVLENSSLHAQLSQLGEERVAQYAPGRIASQWEELLGSAVAG